MRFSLRLTTMIVFLSGYVVAQKLENVRPSVVGDKVIITYDLNYPDVTQKFNVSLYGSHDNYTKPIAPVEGNIGQNVAPGKGLRIVWDAKSSPVNLDSDITFKIRGNFKLGLKPLGNSVYKRGQEVQLNWVGNRTSDVMNIELLRDDKVYKTLAENTPNTFSYVWKIPKNVKPGKDYSIRLTNTSLQNEASATELLTIKPKIPLVIKGLVVAAVAGVVILQPWKSEGPSNELPGLTIKPD